jgi:hypothetical protein
MCRLLQCDEANLPHIPQQLIHRILNAGAQKASGNCLVGWSFVCMTVFGLCLLFVLLVAFETR